MKVCVAGEGAFGQRHIEALRAISDVEIVCLAGGIAGDTQATAQRFNIPKFTVGLEDCLKLKEVEAVILATPTPIHASQGIQCLKAGKHVMVEIPIADSLDDAEELIRVQRETGLVAMGGHTRRFNPSHQWVHRKILAGELKIQQMDVQTFFFRRTNMNAQGRPRSWTDHLLWHHAAHTVDLFQYQTGETASVARAIEGPHHPDLKIAMDLSIQMKVPSGAICTLALSFNNDGPIGTFFRYICDNGTYLARYDDLVDGKENKIDVSQMGASINGIELQDREFIAAIRENREPNASVAQLLPCMETLDRLDRSLSDYR